MFTPDGLYESRRDSVASETGKFPANYLIHCLASCANAEENNSITCTSTSTSETSGQLFVEMSWMENVKKKRCYFALDDDKPTPAADTNKNKIYELPAGNIIPLHDFGWSPHQSESTRLGLTFFQTVHHHVGAECFRCCWKCCSSQFPQYEASGSTTFPLNITMCDVDIRRGLYANVV